MARKLLYVHCAPPRAALGEEQTMNAVVATRYLLALTRQIADLTAELAELDTRPGPTTGDRRLAIASLRSQLRQARRKRSLLLADPFFPRQAPSPEPCHDPADVPARALTASRSS
jgi:hypothetical protein